MRISKALKYRNFYLELLTYSHSKRRKENFDHLSRLINKLSRLIKTIFNTRFFLGFKIKCILLYIKPWSQIHSYEDRNTFLQYFSYNTSPDILSKLIFFHLVSQKLLLQQISSLNFIKNKTIDRSEKG